MVTTGSRQCDVDMDNSRMDLPDESRKNRYIPILKGFVAAALGATVGLLWGYDKGKESAQPDIDEALRQGFSIGSDYGEAVGRSDARYETVLAFHDAGLLTNEIPGSVDKQLLLDLNNVTAQRANIAPNIDTLMQSVTRNVAEGYDSERFHGQKDQYYADVERVANIVCAELGLTDITVSSGELGSTQWKIPVTIVDQTQTNALKQLETKEVPYNLK